MGSFVVESMFLIPGLGRYFVDSVTNLDYPLIMGLTVFYGAFLVTMNLIVDVLYGLIDPRIRVSKGEKMNTDTTKKVQAAEVTFADDAFSPLPEGALDQDQIARKKTTYFKDVWRNFKKNKPAVISLVVIAS